MYHRILVGYDGGDQAQDALALGKDLSQATHFGNPHGRHGAGPLPHNVGVVEAEQVVGAAAVAVVYLAKLLP
jgi:hypothetical protein